MNDGRAVAASRGGRRERRRRRRLGLFDQPADLLQSVHLGVEERRLEHSADGAQTEAIAILDLLGAELEGGFSLELDQAY